MRRDRRAGGIFGSVFGSVVRDVFAPTDDSGAAVYGNIISASLDPQGYAVFITITGSLISPSTDFSAYPLDPDGTPKMTLTCLHAGYSLSGGIAVADVKTRTIYGTSAHRAPATYTGGVPNARKLLETDNGNGTITIKVALSETLFSTASSDGGDTDIKLSLAAGWRTGDPGCSNVPVTNASNVLTPRPGHRWADVPSRRVTGNTIRASIVAFTFHPMQLRGLAAAKFTMRDTAGTVKTAWATGLTTSTTYGDNSRIYEVDLDVSTGTPFVAGPVRIDCEMYPWIGAMRSTDNGTGMTNLMTVAKETPSQRPDAVAYDPAGTRYRTGKDFICIDPAGSSTASAVTVAADWATAKAGTRAATLAVAHQAAYLANRSISGLTRPMDGMVFGFIAGTHAGPGNTSITAGLTTNETWLTLMGDPDDAAPSTNCILESAAGAIAPGGAHRWRISNMSVAFGTNALISGQGTHFWWDAGSIFTGRPGKETLTTSIASSGGTPVGYFNTWATGAKMWKYGSGWTQNGHMRVALVRGCQTSRRIGAAMSMSNTFIQHLDTFITVNGSGQSTGDSVLHDAPFNAVFTDLGAAQDHIQYNNDLRSTDGKSYVGAFVDAATGGRPVRASNLTAFPFISYQFHVNNLVERPYTSGNNIWSSIGENNNYDIYACLFEGNTVVGERNSFGFSKPSCSGTGPITETQRTNWAELVAFRNNAYDKTGHESDRENSDNTLGQNRTFNGVSPADNYSSYRAVGCSNITYGTDCEGNVNFSRKKSQVSDFDNYQDYLGRNSSLSKAGLGAANYYKTDVKYTADKSQHGPITNGATAGAGQGDYHPATGSLLIARALRANTDRTLDNVARTVPFNTGAL